MKKEDVILPEIHGTGNSSAAVKTSRKVTSVKLLVAGAIGLLLYFGHVAFVPVALALLLALVLSGPVEALHAWRVPRAIRAPPPLVVGSGAWRLSPSHWRCCWRSFSPGPSRLCMRGGCRAASVPPCS